MEAVSGFIIRPCISLFTTSILMLEIRIKMENITVITRILEKKKKRRIFQEGEKLVRFQRRIFRGIAFFVTIKESRNNTVVD